MPDDTGRFVGRYLQALAALGVLLMAGWIPLQGVGVSVLGVPVPDPPAVLVAFLGGVLLVAALVPLVLLLNRRARNEFGAA